MTTEQIIGLSLTLLVMLAGLIGSLLPVLPGTPLVLVAAIGHRLYFGQASVSNLLLGILVALTLVSMLFDFLAGMLREAAQLAKDVIVVGVGDRLELWDKAAWNDHRPALLSGVAPVGLGRAACMHPLDAQLPHAMIALAPPAASFTISSAVRPPMQQ